MVSARERDSVCGWMGGAAQVLYKKAKLAFDEGLGTPPSKTGPMSAEEFQTASRAEVVKL
eukprot:COSAG01_NODE_53462_length_339_cov_0.641667_1_plen_59_part_01